MHRLIAIPSAALLLLMGCDVPPPQAPTAPDAGLDADLSPDVALDAALDDSAACLAAMPLGAFEVDPGGPDTQIHAAAAFDGQGVWIAYNLPEADTANFDVHAVRIGCDGLPLAGPFAVNTTTAPNDVDPTLAVSGGRVLIAWLSDDGAQPYNLSTWARPFLVDGAPAAAQDHEIVTARGGLPQPVNTWMAHLNALPDGRFALVGARGLEEAARFQAFIQALTPDGDPDGEALDGLFEAGVTQTAPAAAATRDGALHVAWTRTPDDTDGAHIVHAAFGPDGALLDGPPAPASLALPSDLAALDASPDGQRVTLAFGGAIGGDPQILVKDARSRDPSAAMLILGERGKIDHSPRLALDDAGGAVAWYQVIQGFRNRLLIQRFDDDGERLTAPSPALVVTGEQPAAPYQPALTRVAPGVYLLAWSEGASPAFRVKARFIDLR